MKIIKGLDSIFYNGRLLELKLKDKRKWLARNPEVSIQERGMTE